MRKVFYFLALLMISLGCDDKNSLMETNDSKSDNFFGFTSLSVNNEADYDSSQDDEQQNISKNVVVESKIIKESHLRFETTSTEKTYQSIALWVKQRKGFIQNDKTIKKYEALERSMVIRIPTVSFQIVIDSISDNVNVFDRKEISRRDVTEEFIDLEARLKSKRKLETRYLELLPQAKNVKEILEIEREIAKIREEIEAKQGRLKYLQSKISLSTIYISFYEEISIENPKSQTYTHRIIKAIKGGFNGVGEFFIGLLYVWPFIFIGALLVFFIKRKMKRKIK